MIRRMTLDDVDRVMEITASLKQAPHWPLSAWLAALDSQWAPKRIALVAVDEASGAINGLALGSLLPPKAELESIVVATEAQRRGVGRRLFGALLSEFAAEGVTEVLLEVRASNYAALGLYKTLGLVETGRRVRYYADPVEDALLLTLRMGSFPRGGRCDPRH
jgi:ribosomal-protein-alanine N-acetyltransferase